MRPIFAPEPTKIKVVQLEEITINTIGENIGYRSASASIFIDLKSLSIKLFKINI